MGGNHPNIQSARNSKAVIEYVSKEDKEALRFGSLSEGDETDWYTLLQDAKGKQDFVSSLLQRDARRLICAYANVERFANYYYGNRGSIYESEFKHFRNILSGMQSFHSELYKPVKTGERSTGIVLIGSSKLGKTAWARSLGRHIYWSGGIDWGKYDCDARYAVIDDIDLEYVSRIQQLFGCQTDITVSQKYRPMMNFKWGIPIVYCTNDLDYLGKQPDYLKRWWDINMVEVIIKDRLY